MVNDIPGRPLKLTLLAWRLLGEDEVEEFVRSYHFDSRKRLLQGDKGKRTGRILPRQELAVSARPPWT